VKALIKDLGETLSWENEKHSYRQKVLYWMWGQIKTLEQDLNKKTKKQESVFSSQLTKFLCDLFVLVSIPLK